MKEIIEIQAGENITKEWCIRKDEDLYFIYWTSADDRNSDISELVLERSKDKRNIEVIYGLNERQVRKMIEIIAEVL